MNPPYNQQKQDSSRIYPLGYASSNPKHNNTRYTKQPERRRDITVFLGCNQSHFTQPAVTQLLRSSTPPLRLKLRHSDDQR